MKIWVYVGIWILTMAALFSPASCEAAGWGPLSGWEDRVVSPESRDILKEVWNEQSWQDLRQGKVIIPEEWLNEELNKGIDPQGNVRSVKVKIEKDNKLKAELDLVHPGKVAITARLDELRHGPDGSVMVCTILKKALVNDPILSWFFSGLTMATLSKMAGKQGDLPPTVAIDGNTIRLEFREALYRSKLGNAKVMGMPVLDLMKIEGISTRPGKLEVHVGLDIPPSLLSIMGGLWPSASAEEKQ